MILSLLHILFIISNGCHAFSKGTYYPKDCVWEEHQLKPPKENDSIYLETNTILIMLEMSFPYYMYTYVLETFKPQPILHELEKKNVLESSILLKERTHSFCPRKRELAKNGIARRVKHKQSFAQNWRSRNIDWLLLRWRD